MPHEPKVGELPALRAWLAERESNSNRLANECEDEAAWREDAKYFRAAIESLDALAAEREARKDEARDSERLDWLEKHAKRIGRDGGWRGHYEVIVDAWDGTRYSASRGLALHTDSLRAAIDAALQAEQPHSPTNEGSP